MATTDHTGTSAAGTATGTSSPDPHALGGPAELAPITAFVGHAGVGKTNLVLNLALAQAGRGRHVTVADLDLVNPYFRSSDYPDLLRQAGIALEAPVFARTSLDTPSLSGRLDVAIGQVADAARAAEAAGGRPDDCPMRLIIDVGGDDTGATALGRYSAELEAAGARLYYVVNAFRSLTQTPREAAELLPAIEANSHLRVCGVVNTSNLIAATTLADMGHGRAFAREVARLLGLPLVATAVPDFVAGARELVGQQRTDEDVGGAAETEELFLVHRHVTTPWG